MTIEYITRFSLHFYQKEQWNKKIFQIYWFFFLENCKIEFMLALYTGISNILCP